MNWQLENSERLARATTQYWELMEASAIAADNALAQDMSAAAANVEFDEES